MTEEQLVKKIKQLKEIKPRKEWVVLTKNQIFTAKPVFQPVVQDKISILDIFYANIMHRKFAYSLATIALVLFGMFGFAQRTLPGDALFTVRRMTEQSQAALTGSDSLKNSFDNTTRRMQDLEVAIKDNRTSNIPSAINELKASIEDVTKTLVESGSKDSQAIKDIALEVKKIKDNETLLDQIGGDNNLKQTSDILYKTIDQQMIEDLEKATLTEEQQEELIKAKELFEKEKYSEALEIILLINN